MIQKGRVVSDGVGVGGMFSCSSFQKFSEMVHVVNLWR